MRIRSIKPEFWRSDDISSLSIEDRLLFVGLWSYVDDDGTGVDKLASIAADLFAADLERDPRETFARVSRGLSNLSERSLIVRYEVDGRRYLAVTGWSKHQRVDKPNKSRHPGPDQGIAEVSRDPREDVARPSRLEQRNRGTEEQGNRVSSSPRGDGEKSFAEFYMAYPRKVGKDAARRAFAKAVRSVDVSVVIAGARQFAADPNLPEKQFIPHPSSWLNAGRWDDEPLPTREGGRTPMEVPEGQEWMLR